MKSASSRGLDTSGAVPFEFVLVLAAFFTIFVAVCDLARFYVTTNSVRTLASELVRQTLIYCATAPQTSSCTLPSTGAHSVATAEAKVPFLATSGFATPAPSASRTAMDTSSGVMGITARASYNFNFSLRGLWPITINQVSQRTNLPY
jgi:hypothetical protein